MWFHHFKTVVATLVVAFIGVSVRGADIAHDSAGDSVYNNGWTNGSNGGYGWGGGWQMHAWNTDFQSLLGDSSTNGLGDPEGDGDINSPRAVGGRAWHVVDGYAVRPFSSPLAVGQTFSIDLDDHGTRQYAYGVSVSISLADGSDGLVLFAGQFSDPTPEYALSYRTGFSTHGYVHTGVPLTDQGVHIAFTRLDESQVQVSLTPHLGGVNTTTLDVTLDPSYARQLSQVEFNAFSSSPTPSLNSYINNITITPEPSAVGLMALAAIGLLVRRRGTRS